VSPEVPDAGDPSTGVKPGSSRGGFVRGVRSCAFFLVYLAHMMFTFGGVQRFLIWPLVLLLPARRRRIVGWWFRLQADLTLLLARRLANVQVRIQGTIEPRSCVVVMNHQSVLDIPIAYATARGPYPLIPTRARYRYGMPGVSPLIRMGRLPLVRQGRGAIRADLRSVIAAAEEVARGEQSLLIFPEGHRTRNGEIGPFMKTGLRVILARAHRPVYCLVEDGLWHARTFADVCLRFAGSVAQVVVLGPFDPPPEDAIDAFIEFLREQMVMALRDLRAWPEEREGMAVGGQPTP
jgi:1-acyl-sn-glycerol-3-phosphate acyltransferase